MIDESLKNKLEDFRNGCSLQNSSAGQYQAFGNSLLGCGGYLGGISYWQSPEASPDKNGWYEYLNKSAPKNILCQFEIRTRTPQSPDHPQIVQSWVGYANFTPEFNVAHLYWRLTGIGRMQLESI